MNLPKEVVASLIALVGVFLSVTIALITTRRTVNVELRKLRFQIEQVYASKLLDARLAIYPQVYSFLSAFSKELKRYRLTRNTLETLLKNLDDWDSKNGILFTGDTIYACNRFRNGLIKVLSLNDQELFERVSSEDFVNEWFVNTERFELALKCEIGIYGLEFSDTENIKPKFINEY